MNPISTDSARIEELSKLSRQFKAILENSPDGVVMVSATGQMLYASPSARRMFGFSESDALMFDPAEHTHPEELPMVLTEINKTFVDPGYISTIQYRFRGKNGEWRWIESVISNQLYVPDVEAVVINFRDIHDKMMVLADLKAAKEDAERANSLKDSFISAISHEVRTPLTGITGTLDIIADSLDEKQLEELNPWFEAINRSSARLISTIEDILAFSLLQSDDYKLRNSVFDLNNMISGIVAELSPLSSGRKNKIVTKFPPSSVKLDSDTIAWRSIVFKLIENAIKFTEDGEVTIEVICQKNPRSCVLKVSDTGIGISEEYLQDLFKPYTQEESGYGRPFEGLGLGLPIVKKFIDLTGSTIEVQTMKDHGTTFTVTINPVSLV